MLWRSLRTERTSTPPGVDPLYCLCRSRASLLQREMAAAPPAPNPPPDVAFQNVPSLPAACGASIVRTGRLGPRHGWRESPPASSAAPVPATEEAATRWLLQRCAVETSNGQWLRAAAQIAREYPRSLSARSEDDGSCRTALALAVHAAAQAEAPRLEAVRMLLRAGASLDVRDATGETPLQIAEGGGATAAAQALVHELRRWPGAGGHQAARVVVAMYFTARERVYTSGPTGITDVSPRWDESAGNVRLRILGALPKFAIAEALCHAYPARVITPELKSQLRETCGCGDAVALRRLLEAHRRSAGSRLVRTLVLSTDAVDLTTALHLACLSVDDDTDSADVVDELLAVGGCQLARARDAEAATPLHCLVEACVELATDAVRAAVPRIATALLRAGADPQAQDLVGD